MDFDFELLKKLCETPGAPGREERIRDVIRKTLRPLCDEVETDALGNLIGVKRGARTGKREPLKLMISSHMDEISFLVTHIDDQGFLRFTTLGGFDPRTLTAQRVWVHGKKDLVGVLGSKPIHIMTEAERREAPKIEDFFIDTGLGAKEVRELVAVGDVVTRARKVSEMGAAVTGKSFDNRVGVFVMLEALAKLGKHEADIYAVASVQEEVGLRGATVATRNIDPDVGIALDITLANDVPEAKAHEYITRLGGGAAIKIMDSSVVCHPKVIQGLEDLATKHEIPFQREVMIRGGTDTAALQRSGKGAAVGCISIPTRYVHSVVETCSKADITAAIRLLTAFIEDVHKQDLSL